MIELFIGYVISILIMATSVTHHIYKDYQGGEDLSLGILFAYFVLIFLPLANSTMAVFVIVELFDQYIKDKFEKLSNLTVLKGKKP